MPVGIHRLADGGMTEPGLNRLRVQVGSDQCRSIEVAQVVEPRSLRQAVRRVRACLAAPAALEGRCGWFTADAGISDGQAPAVAEGVPSCHLAKPVGDDHFARLGAEALDVRADLVQYPFVIGIVRVDALVLRSAASSIIFDHEGAPCTDSTHLSGHRGRCLDPGLGT